MFNNLYENDVMDLDAIEELINVAPLKSNKSIKRAAKKGSESPASTIKPLSHGKSTIATKPVDAICNKCNNKVVGDLIGDIYIPHIDKVMPLISYSCTSCGHVGRRSVFTLALPLNEYERKYFN